MNRPERGQCPYCGETFVLRADGCLRHHTGTGRWLLPDGTWAHCCPGCGVMPVTAQGWPGIALSADLRAETGSAGIRVARETAERR